MGLLISVNSVKHGFYDWVMFRDEPIQYPDKNPVLVRYLGPSIDVSPSITAKIMRVNDQVLHRSTYCGLKEEEKSNQSHILLREYFDSNIRDKLGPDISPDDFPGVNLEDTPLYDIYEDNTTDLEGGLSGKTKHDWDPDMATGLAR